MAPEAEIDDGLPHAVPGAGVSLLVVKHTGRVGVLATRCTYRGAPLSDGHVDPDCVICPWHGSMFDLDTVAVMRGPATQPQPVYETRIVDGSVEVRRHEPRALRTNTIGTPCNRGLAPALPTPHAAPLDDTATAAIGFGIQPTG